MTVRDPRPEIVRRQVSIDFDGLPPLPWLPHAAVEVWLKAASMIFPRGERFFIDSVRACQDRVRDPVLLDQIRDFFHQEAMHAKVHADCNAVLDRDYPGRAQGIAWWSDLVFGALDRLPARFRLSVTAGIEHFTAILAHRAFEHEEQLRRTMPERFVDLSLWHAVEETEHKGVCFDVYRAVAGNGLFGYLYRIAGMLVATLLFVGGVLGCARVLRASHRQADRRFPNLKRRRARDDPMRPFEMHSLLRFMGQAVPWPLYFDYYRPSFHPWQIDNAHYVQRWRERNPGFGLS